VVQQLQLLPLQAEEPSDPAVDTIATKRKSAQPPNSATVSASPSRASTSSKPTGAGAYPDMRTFLTACGLAEEVLSKKTDLMCVFVSSEISFFRLSRR
jgi:hypothetical protein